MLKIFKFIKAGMSLLLSSYYNWEKYNLKIRSNLFS